MNFALIPVTKEELNDAFFYHVDEDGNKKWVEEQLHEYWDWFYQRGHVIHTIDRYDSYDDIDYILLYWPDWVWIRKLTNAGQNNKIVYCNAEPPSVVRMNSPEGYEKLKRIFSYILTWNSDWVDNVSIFKKPIHYDFYLNFCDTPLKERKLAVAITACKNSDYENELYSERERAYRFFEEKYPDDFDLYGRGWDKAKHPCYRGEIRDKLEIYHDYAFSICLENSKGLTDYVTEKIFDCLCAGTVPVYGGAPNIRDHVPENCFIDYFAFDSLDELADHLTNMSEEEYAEYLKNGREFITNLDRTPMKYYQIAASAYNAVSHPRMIKVSLKDRLMINARGLKEEFSRKLKGYG